MLFKDRRQTRTSSSQAEDQRKASERRQKRRVPLGLDFSVPVVVSMGTREIHGVARNISEGGMLIQLDRVLPIGRNIAVKFSGRSGEITLEGEIRHQVAWQHSGGPDRKTMYGIGVRFVEPSDEVPITNWVWQTGTSIH